MDAYEAYYDEAYESPVEVGAEPTGSRIGFMTFSGLMLMWFLVLYASVRGGGLYLGAAFLGLCAVLMLLNPANAVLVWILFFFSPDPGHSFAIPSIFKIIVLFSAVAFIMHGRLGSLGKYVNTLSICAFLFVCLISLLLLISPNVQEALGIYGNYIDGLITLFLLFGLLDSKEAVVRVLKWWAIVAAFSLIVSLVHIYFGGSTHLARIWQAIAGGESEERIHVAVESGIARRLVWPGIRPNGQSINLVFPLGAGLALFLSSSGRRKFFWGAVTFVVTVCLVGTFSRSGFLVMLAVGFVYVMMKNIKAIIPGTIFAALGIGVLVRTPELIERIFTIKRNILETGGTGRFDLWAQAFRMWSTSPAFGHGLESYIGRYGMVTHNTYFQLLAETGIIGFALYSFMLFIVLKSLYGLHRRYNSVFGTNPESELLLGLMLGFFGVCLHLGTITYTHVMYLWWICGVCFLYWYYSSNEFYSYCSMIEESDGQES